MQFVRRDCANWRVKWEAQTDDGLTLLVVRDRRPRLCWWWRLRRGGKNLSKGNARDTRHGIRLVLRALREHREGATS